MHNENDLRPRSYSVRLSPELAAEFEEAYWAARLRPSQALEKAVRAWLDSLAK